MCKNICYRVSNLTTFEIVFKKKNLCSKSRRKQIFASKWVEADEVEEAGEAEKAGEVDETLTFCFF